jgi:hypothetical protein
VTRHGNGQGSGALAAKDNIEARAHVSTSPGAPGPLELAQEFLAETASDPRPWPASFAAWAEAHGLHERTARDVRVAVIRQRVFRAFGRHARRRP